MVSRLNVELAVACGGLAPAKDRYPAGELVTVAGVAVVLVGPLDALAGTLGAMWAMSQASAKRVLDLLAVGFEPCSNTGMLRVPVNRFQSLMICLSSDLSCPRGEELFWAIAPGELVVVELAQSSHAFFGEVLGARRIPENGEVRCAGTRVHEYAPEHCVELAGGSAAHRGNSRRKRVG